MKIARGSHLLIKRRRRPSDRPEISLAVKSPSTSEVSRRSLRTNQICCCAPFYRIKYQPGCNTSGNVRVLYAMTARIRPEIQPPVQYTDAVFAPLDRDHQLTRIGGGNETEVYCSDDRRYVIKLKSELGGDLRAALLHARNMRRAADEFVECLGPEHTIPNQYVIARDEDGNVQVLVVQPFIENAHALHHVNYAALSDAERDQVATQLDEIVRRSLSFYYRTGRMPDLYGRSSTTAGERRRLNRPLMLPYRLWSFLVQRNLLRAHNLLLTEALHRRILLVDYDLVRRGWIYRRVYYTVRSLLFWRDRVLIAAILRGMRVRRDR